MIILTGFAGFIGSHIGEYLSSKDSLLLVDHPELYQKNRYFGPKVSTQWDRARDLEIDPVHQVLDCMYFPKLLEKLRPDYQESSKSILREGEKIKAVLHIGAITDTSLSRDPEELRKMNTDYSKVLWNWCAQYKIPFYYASSAATYGLGEQGFSDEHELIPKLKPLNPYAISKQDFDCWALKEADKGNAPPNWYGFKFFNVFGPRESHKGRMASTIFHSFHHIQEHETCTLFRSHRSDVKDGEQKRDFIYVSDVVKVFDFFFQNKPSSGIYNLGSGKARSFYDMASSLFSCMNKEVKIDWVDTPKEFQASYQYFTQADLKKLRSLGYTEEFTSLEEGIRHYLGHLNAN